MARFLFHLFCLLGMGAIHANALDFLVIIDVLFCYNDRMFLTYRYRVRDGGNSTRKALRAQSRSVNFVWNYCCEIDREAQRRWRGGAKVRRPTAFDLANLCRGMTVELGIHSDTIDAICAKFICARNAAFPKTPRFRSLKRSLDWIPVSNFTRCGKLDGNVLTFRKRRYHLWLSRPIPENGKLKTWCFSTDARGRWYVNIQVEISEPGARVGSAIGIDLGLKTLAVLSNGATVETPAFYRAAEEKLATFQRRKQKARARSLAAKVANQRKHFLHVASAQIVRDHAEIYVGDVSPSNLKRTKMAKSVSDAGWAMLRNMLSYKSIATGGIMRVVSERFTSQTCSCCGTIPDSSPKGMGALGIRHWQCSDCGADHDRDVNAAQNILRVGLERQPPVVEILAA